MRASKYPEAAFLAAMTGSATHEVRNVLAIIKESAGLIQDLVLLFGKRGTLDQDKVNQAVERIEAQVNRGAAVLTNLNRLSHTLDQDSASVELSQEVELVVFLSQRFARKKGQRVVAGEMEEECTPTVNALRLHLALFAAMERCLEELPEGSAVTVGVRSEAGAPVVAYLGVPEGGEDVAGPSESEEWRYLEELASSLGATAERSRAGFGIRIHFPQGPVG